MFSIISHHVQELCVPIVDFHSLEDRRSRASFHGTKSFGSPRSSCNYAVILYKGPEIRALELALDVFQGFVQLFSDLFNWFIIQARIASVLLQALLLLRQIKARRS